MATIKHRREASVGPEAGRARYKDVYGDGETESSKGWFSYVFLPKGYPCSVTSDYIKYQIWDSCQALFSNITGTLATKAMFKGVGVGEAEASATAATVNWLARDGAGKIGQILFASMKSSQLDSDAKRWRLAADVTNDTAIFLTILSSYVDPALFLPIVCVASVCTAITGVAGGATRAALTQHFAKSQNMGDVSAKDGNQETAISLLGICIGTVVATLPETAWVTWSLFVLFTILHLFCNKCAVRAVVLSDINRQRLEIMLHDGPAPPSVLAEKEALLFFKTKPIILGVPLSSLGTNDVAAAPPSQRAIISVHSGCAHVAIHREATKTDQVEAYSKAWLMLTKGMPYEAAEKHLAAMGMIEKLREHGWDFDRVLLNTTEYRYTTTD